MIGAPAIPIGWSNVFDERAAHSLSNGQFDWRGWHSDQARHFAAKLLCDVLAY
jgi:hypothetical protein